MLRIWCLAQHQPALPVIGEDGHGAGISGDARLCPACTDLLAYAEQRLATCPFQEQKPACNHCQVHCYRSDRRAQVRQVMRYAGPRMLLRHPWLSLWHLLDTHRRGATRQRRCGTAD